MLSWTYRRQDVSVNVTDCHLLVLDEPPRYMGDKFRRMANVMPVNDEEDIGVLMVRVVSCRVVNMRCGVI